MQEVFLSYDHQDRERIAPLVAALEGLGWQVWWDRRILPGQTWDEAIREALEAARCVVVVWTAHSIHSEWVRIEANHAHERRVLVPVLLDAVRIPLAFQLVQAAPLSGWDGSPQHEGFQVLAAGIRAALGSVAPAGGAAAKAPVGDTAEPRALDAAIGKELALSQPAHLITMIRLAASPGLKKILAEDEESELTPEDVASRPFDLTFQADAASGRLLPAQLTVSIHAPSFDPPTQQKKVRISPGRDSAVFDFLLTPVAAGDLVVHVEAYEGEVCLVSRVLRPVAVEAGQGGLARLVVSMPVAVKVRAAAAGAVADFDETTERYVLPPVFHSAPDRASRNLRVGVWSPPAAAPPAPAPTPAEPVTAKATGRVATAEPPTLPELVTRRRDVDAPQAVRPGASLPWVKLGIAAAILILSAPAIWYSLRERTADPGQSQHSELKPSPGRQIIEKGGPLVKVRIVARPTDAEVLINGEACPRPCEMEVPAGSVEVRASSPDSDPLIEEVQVPGPGYTVRVDVKEGRVTVTR